MKRYSTDELEALPTLVVGQADNLKVDTGTTRVWLSRCGLADGMPWEHSVSVEQYDEASGCWTATDEYDGDAS